MRPNGAAAGRLAGFAVSVIYERYPALARWRTSGVSKP
jgi:hypothetical protein